MDLSLEQFSQSHAETIERLYKKSGGSRWNITLGEFRESLYRSYSRRIASAPALRSPAEIDEFLESIHVFDLALAAGCRRGDEAAWRKFLELYRRVIEGAAHAMISDSNAARDLADSLYAELYGLKQHNGSRNCPFDKYQGRSGLGGWLRTVIARRAADSWRANRPMEPIENVHESELHQESGAPDDPNRARYLAMVCDSIKRALNTLSPADRLRLSYYYLQGLKLAQIGVLEGEHESTVSRKLTSTRNQIRVEVERILSEEHHLSADQIALSFEYATEDWPFNLAEILSQAKQ
jgi:RNA polymerase sigma-70 factor, ECF subfamily